MTPRARVVRARFGTAKPWTRERRRDPRVRWSAHAPGRRAAAVGRWGFDGQPLARGVGLANAPAKSASRPLAAATCSRSTSRTRVWAVQGRDFTDAEERQAQPVVIVDESLVREAFPGETNVIGKTLKLGWGLQNSRIIGVVTHQRAIDISREIRPQVFATLGSLFQNQGFVVVRGNGDLRELTAAIVRAISEERPGRAVTTIAMLSDNVAAATSTLTAVTALVTSLAISAGVLSAIGLYLVLSFIVDQQRRATAIRTALGASPGQVMWQHGRTSALVMLIAIPIGVGLALAIAPYLAELLFRVGRRDGSSVAIAIVAAALTAATGTALPIVRAANANIVEVLRGD